jgi:RHS repeat-associated protein
MLDESGHRIWEAAVSTWGVAKILLGHADDCPHRFAGQYEDIETGLAYNRHRYFDPEAGQYLCVDPIRLAGGLNSFAYVDDPLVESDPLGLAKVQGPGSCFTPPEGLPRRNQNPQDRTFQTRREALEYALRAYRVPSRGGNQVVNVKKEWGKNPNLLGPKGEPYEVVSVINMEDRRISFHHHASGHVFKDKDNPVPINYEYPHYHGPNGAHYSYLED